MGDVVRPDRLDRVTIEERRASVAQLYLRHQTIRSIARRLGVSVGTVAADLDAIRAEWRREHQGAIQERFERDLMELDEMERDAVLQFVRLLAGTLRNDDGTTTVFVGEALPWADLRLRIKARRAKMLGFDTPDSAPSEGESTTYDQQLQRAHIEFAQAMHAVADEGDARRRIEEYLAGAKSLVEGGR